MEAEHEKHYIRIWKFRIDSTMRLSKIVELLSIMIPLSIAIFIPGWRIAMNTLHTQENIAQLRIQLDDLHKQSDKMQNDFGDRIAKLQGQFDSQDSYIRGFVTGEQVGKKGH